jgi:hypothetical protein
MELTSQILSPWNHGVLLGIMIFLIYAMDLRLQGAVSVPRLVPIGL